MKCVDLFLSSWSYLPTASRIPAILCIRWQGSLCVRGYKPLFCCCKYCFMWLDVAGVFRFSPARKLRSMSSKPSTFCSICNVQVQRAPMTRAAGAHPLTCFLIRQQYLYRIPVRTNHFSGLHLHRIHGIFDVQWQLLTTDA